MVGLGDRFFDLTRLGFSPSICSVRFSLDLKPCCVRNDWSSFLGPLDAGRLCCFEELEAESSRFFVTRKISSGADRGSVLPGMEVIIYYDLV